jgi:predicted negative regulator of RcsB-dependent stress response
MSKVDKKENEEVNQAIFRVLSTLGIIAILLILFSFAYIGWQSYNNHVCQTTDKDSKYCPHDIKQAQIEGYDCTFSSKGNTSWIFCVRSGET